MAEVNTMAEPGRQAGILGWSDGLPVAGHVMILKSQDTP
jgi:hypothetical protein